MGRFLMRAAAFIAMAGLLLAGCSNPAGGGGIEQVAGEFRFTVKTAADGDQFFIPVSGNLNGVSTVKPYNWDIDWGDGNTETKTGGSAADSAGIGHTYTAAGTYTITIKPAGSEDAWLGAFGFSNNTDGANAQANKDRVVSVDSPLEPLMTRTRAQINGGTAPDWEWAYTFYWCKNPGFTMGPGFGFSPAWDSIATVGDGFAFAMFYNCAGAAFNMNNVFNLPRNITAAGDNFAAIMFDSCLGATFNMNSGFNLPQGITIAGDLFAFSMFYNCSGAAFNMNSVFNLPQGITAAGDGFAADMFADCSGAAFLVNGVFTFPRPASFSLGTDAFKETFSLGTSTRTQSRSATSIINGNAAPTSDMNTFGPSGAWSDYGTIGANWQE